MVSKTDLKFYYTSAEPFVTQAIPSQSIGGYASDSLYGASALLVGNLGVQDLSFTVNSALAGPTFLMDDEIVQASGSGTAFSSPVKGALGTRSIPHQSGSPVYALPQTSLFNNALSDSLGQYRCLAVKNTNSTYTFYNLGLYFKNVSRTDSTIVRMAVEVPRTDYHSGTVSKGSIISITDTTLVKPDNWYKGCVVRVLTGRNVNARRTVISFDSAQSMLVLDSALPFAMLAGETYEIQNAPAQRLPSGEVAPTVRLSQWVVPDRSTRLGIDAVNDRVNAGNLAPNETIYLWLWRQRSANAPSYVNNRVIFSAHYNAVNVRGLYSPAARENL